MAYLGFNDVSQVLFSKRREISPYILLQPVVPMAVAQFPETYMTS